MMPSPFLSANVNGRRNRPFTGKPTESRAAPVPIVLFGFPFASKPSVPILFELCEPEIVRSQPNCERSTICVLIAVSQPLFWTEAMFERTVVAEGAADVAIGRLTSASFVFLL